MSETISQKTNTEITKPVPFNEFIENNSFSSYTEAVEAHSKAVEEYEVAINALGDIISLRQ